MSRDAGARIVFGNEYQLSQLNTIPLVLTAAFQVYVSYTTTLLAGGIYKVLPFIAATGSNANSEIEVRITVSAPGPTIVFQTLTVDQTYTGAGDVLPFFADIPIILPEAVYTVDVEARQPISPGVITVISAGVQVFRAL